MPFPYRVGRTRGGAGPRAKHDPNSVAGLARGRPPNPGRYGGSHHRCERRVRVSERLQPGDVAPGFELPDADGAAVSLASLRGRRVILYFYPAAMTPGCTKESVDFEGSLAELDAAGVTVVGISPDKPAKLAKFREKEGLTFPLLSDPDAEVLKAYGAYGEKKLYGKVVVGVIRSTFVIDAEGKVEKAYYNVKATGHVERLRRDLGV
ncbi:thioredoxin-dependent thiol peroxidase [Actinomadura bangladeshensis]|uniref:thioredoxin-dependent peroxiredoxin n=1 Tax=Actinomadura bangladeshensis TaxID=453573 RepID=A0A4V2XKQ1_9ACTN|nr:thioredoxin-dependent thiol peroxidase [Actinomadura bangladeshensis]